jgi:hypothetical protein
LVAGAVEDCVFAQADGANTHKPIRNAAPAALDKFRIIKSFPF